MNSYKVDTSKKQNFVINLHTDLKFICSILVGCYEVGRYKNVEKTFQRQIN